MQKLEIKRDEHGHCEKYAWPGGYPIFYLCADGGILCPDCVDAERQLIEEADDYDKQWLVVAADVNWEDESLTCDHCNKRIPSAYGDDEPT